jgi:hypothetical protein
VLRRAVQQIACRPVDDLPANVEDDLFGEGVNVTSANLPIQNPAHSLQSCRLEQPTAASTAAGMMVGWTGIAFSIGWTPLAAKSFRTRDAGCLTRWSKPRVMSALLGSERSVT